MININSLKDKLVHIVGISGMEGWAAAEFLADKGVEIVGHDFVSKEDIKDNFFGLRDYLTDKEKEESWQRFKNFNFKINYKSDYLNKIEKADLIFLPQSWFRYDFNKLLKEIVLSKKIIGILDLYLSFCPATIIGITGSNGKSTTSRMAHLILKSEKKALLSGNDRENLPVLNKIESLNKEDYLILEISNRQLINFNGAIDIGLITNIFPTHIDDHGTFENYKQAKGNLIAGQNKNQKAIINFDDNKSSFLKELGEGEKYFFSRENRVKRGCYLEGDKIYCTQDDKPVFDIKKLKVPGSHNQENALAAICLAKTINISNDNIRNSLKNFKGAKHRLEFVAELRGVSYFNDSQSTNPGSTVVGLNSFDQPIILIAGGKSKPNSKDFDILAKEIEVNKNIKKVFLIGESADQMTKVFNDNNLDNQITEKCLDLEVAFKRSNLISKRGDVVLLSPATESFGEFSDYRDRGNTFKQLVKSISND
jgi:UDP-N-acetylmuramoylalanine--D-glutamate ligase